jgi:hypothetical protein
MLCLWLADFDKRGQRCGCARVDFPAMFGGIVALTLIIDVTVTVQGFFNTVAWVMSR